MYENSLETTMKYQKKTDSMRKSVVRLVSHIHTHTNVQMLESLQMFRLSKQTSMYAHEMSSAEKIFLFASMCVCFCGSNRQRAMRFN